MAFASPFQKLQDWITQQWVIFSGRRIDPEKQSWLMGPIGNVGKIADNFIDSLAAEEGLIIERNTVAGGLIPSLHELNLPSSGFSRISKNVISFYEHTASYELKLSVHWNRFFNIFGKLIVTLYSRRLKQLNIPTRTINEPEPLTSEIIALKDPISSIIKYTVWYRTFIASGEVLYSGVYSICTIPSGKKCIKATFPLPNGNATIILAPDVDPDGALILESAGKEFGDPGFYFVLKDSEGHYWSTYIQSFRDHLRIYDNLGRTLAQQTLTLWNKRVLQFNYEILKSKSRP